MKNLMLPTPAANITPQLRAVLTALGQDPTGYTITLTREAELPTGCGRTTPDFLDVDLAADGQHIAINRGDGTGYDLTLTEFEQLLAHGAALLAAARTSR